LVEAIAEALIPSLDKPFIFFGHSMGGLLSFELARKLHMQQDLSPSHLFVSGRHAPQLPDPDPPIHNLPEPDFLEALRRLNGTPLVVLEDAELMQMVLPTVRADLAVVETYTYRPAPPLNCPITVFGGWQDPKTSPDLLDAWREQTTAGFSRRMLPGDHFFLHTAQAGLLELLAHNL
jgi:medium-chain acyl-[acyl-carrier-protein] hydrolase